MAVAALAAGCSSCSPERESRPEQALSATTSPSTSATAVDLTVLVAEARNAEHALVTGSLKSFGGCLGVGNFVVVWPNGTQVVGHDPVAIDVPDYGTFSLGDDIALGGGGRPAQSSEKLEAEYVVAGTVVPAECAKHEIWLAN